MQEEIIIRLHQPNAKGMCDFEDADRDWRGAIFVPLTALRQMLGEPFAYFQASVDTELANFVIIRDRLPDQRWVD